MDYAPRKKVVGGDKKVLVASIKWSDQKRYSKPMGLANHLKKFFRKNSRGLLTLDTKSKTVRVNLKAKKKNVRKAENYIRNRYKGYQYYVIINNIKKGNSAGKNIAHLRSGLGSTGCHEVGHLLGLGHAGTYNKNGKLDHYGDGQSVMSRYPSAFISAPQYYHQGWLFKNEVALHDENGPEKTYTLRRITKLEDRDMLAGVLIPMGANRRRAFVAFPKCYKGDSCVALYLTNGGGSQRIQLFKTEYYDKKFTGLLIKKINYEDGKITISISKPELTKESLQTDSEFTEVLPKEEYFGEELDYVECDCDDCESGCESGECESENESEEHESGEHESEECESDCDDCDDCL